MFCKSYDLLHSQSKRKQRRLDDPDGTELERRHELGIGPFADDAANIDGFAPTEEGEEEQGLSTKGVPMHSLAAYEDYLRAKIPKEKVAFVGHSLGNGAFFAAATIRMPHDCC